MPSLMQNRSDIIRQTVAEYQHLPPLSPDSKQTCLEFFFEDLEVPNFVIYEDRLISAIPLAAPSTTLQIIGDDGAIFIQVDGEVLLDRTKNYRFPDLSLGSLPIDIEALEAAVEKLKAIT